MFGRGNFPPKTYMCGHPWGERRGSGRWRWVRMGAGGYLGTCGTNNKTKRNINGRAEHICDMYMGSKYGRQCCQTSQHDRHRNFWGMVEVTRYPPCICWYTMVHTRMKQQETCKISRWARCHMSEQNPKNGKQHKNSKKKREKSARKQDKKHNKKPKRLQSKKTNKTDRKN